MFTGCVQSGEQACATIASMKEQSSTVGVAVKNKALEYAMTKGFSVIPVGSDKVPLIKWREFENRIAEPEEIEAWFKKWPEANIGIVTGKISNITVVDIDVKDKPHMTPANFPATYEVSTPSGGSHLYYDYQDGIKNVARGWNNLPGVDIRNDGGYVVAPPSTGYELKEGTGGTFANFPIAMFNGGKTSKKSGSIGSFSLNENVGVTSGGRNDSMTKVIGSMLATVPEGLWIAQVWPVIEKINATYVPPLPHDELKRTFESIATKEKIGRVNTEETRKLIESPFQMSDIEAIKMKLRGNRGNTYKDVTNAVFAFASHSDWIDAFKYDTFQKQMTFRGKELKDEDIVTAQMWLQRDLDLNGISKKVVEDAINRRAHDCEYNSVVDWLKELEWDGVPRLDNWIPTVYGVESDEYHRAIGSNWLRAMVQRLVWPGTKYDHVLVIQGGQGTRKTTSFSVLGGGKLHVETTIRADSKDFLMQFDGRSIVEFSEGETLNRSETKALKAIITRTHDKYRAPYARSDEEHPRQCVFCMTTNDTEYLKDDTGNRRWLIVKMPENHNADTEWLKEHRDQLFAEAYARREEPTWIYPEDVAREWQEQSRVADSLEDTVIAMYQTMKPDYRGEGISIQDVYDYVYRNIPEDRRSPVIDRMFEWRAKSILKGVLKLEYSQRRVDGVRIRKWFPTIETDRACPYVSGVALDFEED